MNPYKQCPVYESEHFLLRLVAEEDASALLPCYAEPSASVQASSEHCTYGYGARTLEEIQDFIRSWLKEYRERHFVRFAIVAKECRQAVGTIEMFAFSKKLGVLRIDLPASYETRQSIDELLRISNHFFGDFCCETIVTKVFSAAEGPLRACGYSPYPRHHGFQRDGYWAKEAT